MKQRKNTPSFWPCIFTLSLPTLVAAQNCSAPAPWSVNATGSQILIDPFRTPTGPFSIGSGNWTWNVATESLPSAGPVQKIRQTLWLETQPSQDFLSTSQPYLGCGLVTHGLKQSLVKQGQNDNGTCESVFNSKCITALVDGTAQYAAELVSDKSQTVQELCAQFGVQGRNGVPSDCGDAFENDGFIESVPLISPQLLLDPCEIIHWGNHENASQPLSTWGLTTYSPTNMTAYENLTTQVTPLVSVMFENHTTDHNYTLGWSQAHLTCLRPSSVQGGSKPPTGVPNLGGMRRGGIPVVLPLVVTAFLAIFFVSV